MASLPSVSCRCSPAWSIPDGARPGMMEARFAGRAGCTGLIDGAEADA